MPYRHATLISSHWNLMCDNYANFKYVCMCCRDLQFCNALTFALVLFYPSYSFVPISFFSSDRPLSLCVSRWTPENTIKNAQASNLGNNAREKFHLTRMSSMKSLARKQNDIIKTNEFTKPNCSLVLILLFSKSHSLRKHARKASHLVCMSWFSVWPHPWNIILTSLCPNELSFGLTRVSLNLMHKFQIDMIFENGPEMLSKQICLN